LIPSIVTAAIVLLTVVVTLIFSSPSRDIAEDKIAKKDKEVPDGTAKIEVVKEKEKASEKKKTLAKKQKRTSKPRKKIAKKKRPSKTAKKLPPKEKVEKKEKAPRKEESGVSMGGKNFIYSEPAEKGLTPQQYFKSGYKYELARNMPQAKTYYTTACKMKYGMGCYRLGSLNKDPKTLAKARKLFSKECNKGKSKSCTNLANMLLKGEGGPKSPYEATTTLAKQCSSGSVTGCFLLAEIWAKGDNIKKDLTKARKYFGFSCEKGSKVGCYKFASMLENGSGGSADKEKAKKFYKKACLKGYVKACMKSK